jgi:IS5 family transposase
VPRRRLIAILLTGGEAHDCPLAERLIRRVKLSKHLLGDKTYDSAELRGELDENYPLSTRLAPTHRQSILSFLRCCRLATTAEIRFTRQTINHRNGAQCALSCGRQAVPQLW